MTEFIKYFDRIYIINLEHRADRRIEIDVQLKKIKLSLDDPKVTLFNAIKPLDAGEFPSIGARGCFLSHLGILKDAKNNNFQRILVFEDDLDLIDDFANQSNLVLNDLLSSNWDIFYGDYRVNEISLSHKKNTIKVNHDLSIGTTDFIGFNGQVIDTLIDYFEAMLNRQGGDQLGGPMHVDGAYTWFRKNHEHFSTLLTNPPLGYQRSSQSDIADPNWKNKIPFVSVIRAFLNRIKKQ